ncbi:MAG: MBL fold metallo-hydrolase [Alphaproteobacteria bacterium]
MKVTILGCGSSSGVPVIGCQCAVCLSTDPKNSRMRVSVLVEEGPTAILVDTSPDCRKQLLAAKVHRLDAVVWTHDHADHTHGIDEVRSISHATKAPLPVYADTATLVSLQARFGYAFMKEGAPMRAYVPNLVPRQISGPFSIGSIAVTPFTQLHGIGREATLGLRFGRFAYSTDVKELPEQAFEALQGIDTWVVDCLMEYPSPAHSHLTQTLEWIERVKPRRAILTHMNHRVDYQTWKAKLPPHIEPGYDGMILEVP